jgi:hypothetical protein
MNTGGITAAGMDTSDENEPGNESPSSDNIIDTKGLANGNES